MVVSSTPSRSRRAAWILAAACAQLAACYAGLGLPAFILLCILLLSRLTRERWAGETSAYSVFNPRGQRIAGSLTAEQIDGQLRGGRANPQLAESGQGHFGRSSHRWGQGCTLQGGGGATHETRAPDDDKLRRRRSDAAADAALRRQRSLGEGVE